VRLPKEVQDLFDYAVAKGFVLMRDKRHIVMQRRDVTVVISRSPSCPRSTANTKARIDRAVRRDP